MVSNVARIVAFLQFSEHRGILGRECHGHRRHAGGGRHSARAELEIVRGSHLGVQYDGASFQSADDPTDPL
ncbi:hypothetical protein AU476_18750 [Cupriavidus sp. UYMSc13B]|nr:hypothetical protein AU476_18750 [Cupriavidus sp. UYMSc13B]